MALTLSVFLRQQLAAQQLTEREFATRAGLGLSHVYQILRGDRKHTRGDTLDKIAAALGMTPADMAIAMGRAGEIDPDETELLAIYRQVPHEDRPAVKRMIHGLWRREHHAEHDVTDEPEDLVRHKCEGSRQVPPVQRRYESQSVASQIARYGFQPATV